MFNTYVDRPLTTSAREAVNPVPNSKVRVIDHLPHPDQRTGNKQHHLWTRADFRRYNLSNIRGLPCASSKVDALVHSLFHRLWDPPQLTSDVIAQVLAIGQRHSDQECTCGNPEGRVRVNALTLREVSATDTTPGCLVWKIDPAVLQFLWDNVHAVPNIILADNIIPLLVERHRQRACDCAHHAN
jgi:hypothetical protein